MEDFAAHKASGVERSRRATRATYCTSCRRNNQGLTALLLLNILEGIDLQALRADPVRYYTR